MKTVNIINAGKTSKGLSWGLIQENHSGFLMTAFVKSEQELSIGELEIPVPVHKALQWRA